MKKLTHRNIRYRLLYNRETGIFVWLNGKCKWKEAGCLYKNGYRYIWFLDFQRNVSDGT